MRGGVATLIAAAVGMFIVAVALMATVPQRAAPYIVMLDASPSLADRATALATLRSLCGLPGDTGGAACPGVRLAACQHVYRQAVVGFAASLTPAVAAGLRACLPRGSLVESDAAVARVAERARAVVVGTGAAAAETEAAETAATETEAAGGASAGRRRRSRRLAQDWAAAVRGDDGAESSRLGQEPFDDLRAAVDAGPWPMPAGEPLPRALWNLDRIDQRTGGLDGRFTPAGDGSGVVIYVLDSGVATGHREFGGRADMARDLTNTGNADCSGHGTHVASVAAGSGVGIARGARVRAYKVLGCDGDGRSSSVVAAIDAILDERRAAAGGPPPGVAVMSLSTQDSSQVAALEVAVRALLLANVTVVAASGNEGPGDACDGTPARVPGVISVAASDLASKFDGGQPNSPHSTLEPIYPYSLTGRCVALFAPGTDILGACASSERCAAPGDASYAWSSGTSMAAPHVAGAAALHLGANPTASPADVKAALSARATRGVLGGSLQVDTPNLLLYVGRDE